jgi:hypothetical protein
MIWRWSYDVVFSTSEKANSLLKGQEITRAIRVETMDPLLSCTCLDWYPAGLSTVQIKVMVYYLSSCQVWGSQS